MEASFDLDTVAQHDPRAALTIIVAVALLVINTCPSADSMPGGFTFARLVERGKASWQTRKAPRQSKHKDDVGRSRATGRLPDDVIRIICWMLQRPLPSAYAAEVVGGYQRFSQPDLAKMMRVSKVRCFQRMGRSIIILSSSRTVG